MATARTLCGGFADPRSRLPVEIRSQIFHLSHSSWCTEALSAIGNAGAQITPASIETKGDKDVLLLANAILDHRNLYGFHLRGSPFHVGAKATFHPLHTLRLALAGTVMSEEENQAWASAVRNTLSLIHPKELTILTDIVLFHHIVRQWPTMPSVSFLKVDFECPDFHMLDPDQYEIGEESSLDDYAWNQPEWGDMLSRFPHITEFYLRTISGLEVNEWIDDRRAENVPRILADLKKNCPLLEKVSIEAWGSCWEILGNVVQRLRGYQYSESSGEWECITFQAKVPSCDRIISY
ncbi:hypothetical protein FA13DRAFT_1804424 [Coprinellus micaceus]|uniref:Uncharacterized protein n=1 Tax=Coprinellus micaceus TaxID=71717 RepID=A0A4Y7S8W5_COPMI|nr:hypothetical protein FA13DRAFT_1804424 [Coprinellus micaceus]